MKRGDEQSYVVRAGDSDLADIPFILMFGDEIQSRAQPVLKPHLNKGIEICLCRSGIYKWNIEGAITELHPGESSVTRPWEYHSGVDDLLGPGRLTWIIINADFNSTENGPKLSADGISFLLGQETNAILNPFSEYEENFLGSVPEITILLDDIHRELTADLPGRTASLRAAATRLLISVSRRLSELNGTANQSEPGGDGDIPEGVLEALGKVTRDPGGDWSTTELAKNAGMGITAFTRWCRIATGRAPRWFILEKRLELTKTLLGEGELSITQISLDAGFSSSQHFSTAFKKLYGVTPSGYRKSVQDTD